MDSPHSFATLTEMQNQLLLDAPALITILVAGADGVIDEQELNWAEKLTHIRSYAEPEELNQYYESVEAAFDLTLENYMSTLPNEQAQRERDISKKLAQLNEVLGRLDNPIAYRLYQSLLSFAKHIAKASGGFLRFGSISREEKKWIGLSMIDPVILEIEEELNESEEPSEE